MEITERYIVNLDPNLTMLRAQGHTHGQRLMHRGVLIDISGAATWDEAMALIQKEADRRGWRWRAHWWQVWLPKRPRRLTA